MSTSLERSASREKNPISSNEHYQIVIVGGGAAGITTAAQLLKQNSRHNIAVIEPSEKHYYQPGWTLVGGGIAPIDKFIRQEKEVIPQGAKWTQMNGQQLRGKYDGYTCCPLITGYHSAIMAEFDMKEIPPRLFPSILVKSVTRCFLLKLTPYPGFIGIGC